MLKLKEIKILESKDGLAGIPEGKVLINTINAYSYNNSQKDAAFSEALQKGDYLIPDGMSVVWACRVLHAKSQPKERIAGWDLFSYEMQSWEKKGEQIQAEAERKDSDFQLPCVMFMGSSEKVLSLICEHMKTTFPHLRVVTYSPPYKPVFNEEDNRRMIEAVNQANPDLLWIGMTAPKQEKWTYQHWNSLNIHCHVGTIGAVFDFFAGTVKRAPVKWQRKGAEWLYRLIKEPKRTWKRYILGNTEFLCRILKECIC